MAILEKIKSVRDSLAIEKTGYDEKNEYHYFKADDVAAGVRASMVNHGIIHRSEIVNLDIDNFWDQNGRNRPRVTAHVKIVFVDSEDGSEFATEVVATGADIGGDKATRKMHVQAFKEACIDVFTISEGMSSMDSDAYPEAEPIKAESSEPVVKAATSKELGKELTDLINSQSDEHSHITGPVAIEVGRKVALEVLGKTPADSAWKKDSRVLEPLIERLKNGEVG